MLDDSCVEYINDAHRIAGLTVLPGFLAAGTRARPCAKVCNVALTTTCRDTQTSRTRWYESWRECSRASATRLQSIGTRLSSAIENASDRCSSSRPRINTPSSGLPTPLYTFRYTTHTAHTTHTTLKPGSGFRGEALPSRTRSRHSRGKTVPSSFQLLSAVVIS